ncbi:hypothetical protein X975_17778, partial [Stegodyphus mimosarum]
MALRCYFKLFASLVFFLLLNVMSSQSAPAFKLKSYMAYRKNNGAYPPRSDRRLMDGTSPIHFINPFVPPSESMNPFSSLYSSSGLSGSAAGSAVYRLPLRLFSNGKPHSVIHGFPSKSHHVMDFLPHAVSNIIRLPLKYISNAKPIGVYLKDPSFNYL